MSAEFGDHRHVTGHEYLQCLCCSLCKKPKHTLSFLSSKAHMYRKHRQMELAWDIWNLRDETNPVVKFFFYLRLYSKMFRNTRCKLIFEFPEFLNHKTILCKYVQRDIPDFDHRMTCRHFKMWHNTASGRFQERKKFQILNCKVDPPGSSNELFWLLPRATEPGDGHVSPHQSWNSGFWELTRA